MSTNSPIDGVKNLFHQLVLESKGAAQDSDKTTNKNFFKAPPTGSAADYYTQRPEPTSPENIYNDIIWKRASDAAEKAKSMQGALGGDADGTEQTLRSLAKIIDDVEMAQTAKKPDGTADPLTGPKLQQIIDAVLRDNSKANRDFIALRLAELFGRIGSITAEGGTIKIHKESGRDTDNTDLLNPAAATLSALKNNVLEEHALYNIQKFLVLLRDKGATGFTQLELAQKLCPLLNTDVLKGVVHGDIDRKYFLALVAKFLTDGTSLLHNMDLIEQKDAAGKITGYLFKVNNSSIALVADGSGNLHVKEREPNGLTLKTAADTETKKYITLYAKAYETLSTGDTDAINKLADDLFKKDPVETQKLDVAVAAFVETLDKANGKVDIFWLYNIWKLAPDKANFQKDFVIGNIIKALPNSDKVKLMQSYEVGKTLTERDIPSDDEGWKKLADKFYDDLDGRSKQKSLASAAASDTFNFIKLNPPQVTEAKNYLGLKISLQLETTKLNDIKGKITDIGKFDDNKPEEKTKKEQILKSLGIPGNPGRLTALSAAIVTAVDPSKSEDARKTAQTALRNDPAYTEIIKKLDANSLVQLAETAVKRGNDIHDQLEKVLNIPDNKVRENAIKALNTQAAAGNPGWAELSEDKLKDLSKDLSAAVRDTADGETRSTSILNDPKNAPFFKVLSTYEIPQAALTQGGGPGGLNLTGGAPAQNIDTAASPVADMMRQMNNGLGIESNDYQFTRTGFDSTGKVSARIDDANFNGMLIHPRGSGKGIFMVPVLSSTKDKEGNIRVIGFTIYQVNFDANGIPTLQTSPSLGQVQGSFAIQLENRPGSGLGPILWFELDNAFLTLVTNDENFATADLKGGQMTAFGAPAKGAALIEQQIAKNNRQYFELKQSGDWLTQTVPTDFLRPAATGFYDGKGSAQADRAEAVVNFLQSLMSSGGLVAHKDDLTYLNRLKDLFQDLRGIIVGTNGPYPNNMTREQIMKMVDDADKTIQDYAVAAKAAKDSGKAVSPEDIAKLTDADPKLRLLQAVADAGMQELMRKAGRRPKDRIDLDALIAQWRRGGMSLEELLYSVLVVMLDGTDEEVAHSVKSLGRISDTQKNLRPNDAGAGGILHSLQTDSAVEQTRLQMLVTTRQRLIESVTNAQKTDQEAKENAIRRMV